MPFFNTLREHYFRQAFNGIKPHQFVKEYQITANGAGKRMVLVSGHHTEHHSQTPVKHVPSFYTVVVKSCTEILSIDALQFVALHCANVMVDVSIMLTCER